MQTGAALRLGVPSGHFQYAPHSPHDTEPHTGESRHLDPVVQQFQGFLRDVMDAGTAVVKAYSEEPKHLAAHTAPAQVDEKRASH